MEELSLAREKWYEAEVRKKDEMNRKRQELLQSHQDMNAVNKALGELGNISISFKNKEFTKKPELHDFYRPSSEFKHYEKFVVGSVGLVGGLVGGGLISYALL